MNPVTVVGRRSARWYDPIHHNATLVLLVALAATAIAVSGEAARCPDALGWTLLLAAHASLLWRHRAPMTVLLATLACVVPYHILDNNHLAPTLASYLALYTVAVTGRPLRTLLTGVVVVGVATSVMLMVDTHRGVDLLRTSGWAVAVLVLGAFVRVHRQHLVSVVERAERAERTREEEARRRVAEERLRIARDLHDLLAHTITLIGVQTSVAAHVLSASPGQLDRKAVAAALDDIAETCRTARGELRATLQVLRADGPEEPRGPLPGLDGLPDLVDAARTAGAEVTLSVRGDGTPPAVGAAAYRIVQEALTNAVRHAGPGVGVSVGIRSDGHALRVSVTDDGPGPPLSGNGQGEGRGSGLGSGQGFGLAGMRERARSVGGSLEAGPGPGGGFAVTADLPLTTHGTERGEGAP
ncbi:sensor histidine kinase [Streptomyces sp. NPDC091292]|uniref:sensor histidine kinase n=1 Tax=Streptomyces sp. NPDC091292 TaxID=3365991 RepID=UPI0037FBB08A